MGLEVGLELIYFTGADYYIAKKVYLGVEAGLSFISGKGKDTVVEERVANVVKPTITTNGAKKFDIATEVFGGIRIGYQF